MSQKQGKGKRKRRDRLVWSVRVLGNQKENIMPVLGLTEKSGGMEAWGSID
jgi:hypothetical protein